MNRLSLLIVAPFYGQTGHSPEIRSFLHHCHMKLFKSGDWFLRVTEGVLEIGYDNEMLDEEVIFEMSCPQTPVDEVLQSALCLARFGADLSVLTLLLVPFVTSLEPSPHLGEFDPALATKVLVN